MVKLLRLVLAFAILALLVAPLMAVQFNVTVNNQVGTRLPGTKVQIMVANTTLYEQITKWCPKINDALGCFAIEDRALAQFELAPGTYFLRLQRSAYPDHVYLQTITEDTDLRMILYMQKSTYTIFGRVASDISNYEGETIKLVDDTTGAVIRSSNVKANNYFILESLWPDKMYHVRIDRGTDRLLSKSFSHAEVGAYYVEINAAVEPLRNITVLPTFSGSIQTDLHSKLRLRLTAGERPMIGQTVIVTTPSGSINLTTDSDGYIQLWAAESGDYVFDWQTLKHIVNVPAAQTPAPKPVVTQPTPAEPVSNVAPPVPSTDSGAAFGALSVVALLAIGAVIVIFVLLLAGPRILKSMNAKKDSHVFEPVKPAEPVVFIPPAVTHEPKHEAHHKAKHPAHKAAKHVKHKKK